MGTIKNYPFTNDLIFSTTRASINRLTNDNRFKKIDPDVLSLLTDITVNFMFKVSRETAKLRHHINSNSTSVDDVLFTLQDFNMQIPDIHCFMTCTQMIVPPINLPVFPVNTDEPPKEYELTAKEKRYRKANEIPDFLPPIWSVIEKKKASGSMALKPSEVILRPRPRIKRPFVRRLPIKKTNETKLVEEKPMEMEHDGAKMSQRK